ncbi:uncharacterized protein LOC117100266 isoform X2 [Anneissia japonica]|uniref:uncharacterized protein LOC117100266 isoform X2 n=1 Tax=Anneissia japonica TaxID=1529436 RepID=UPI0014255B57|nr:uncharacterized protein LOC117100266 isoform X2 [Anneissia japonica]
MSPGLITAVLMFVGCSQIEGSDAVTGLVCQRSYNVQEKEFGFVYEYFHDGDDVSCAYEFRGEEGQRVMLAVSHIGLLPKQPSDDQCIPQLTITDVSPTGDETTAIVICDDNDANVKGSFVSSANMAKVTFTGPSDNGILLLQFWFVQDVKLIKKEVFSTPEPPEPTIDVGLRLNTSNSGCLEQSDVFSLAGIEVQCDDDNSFRPLQCSRWGQDLSLSRCICVDKITGKTNALEPPYCLESPESFHTRCLQELAEIRHAISLKEFRIVFYDFQTYPPTCDSAGNYLRLQCRYPLE